MADSTLDALCINTIRFLSVDAVEKAGSGHPGTPMGAAALAYVLWDRFLKHNPLNPHWPNRDRFVLSAGHASMLLYSLLYLTGYGISLEDLRQFRQWGSKTPGHPEYGLTAGVEATTGPLGQGFANGVGMAIAECHLANRYNRPGYEIFNHYTYALISDGDLQEGISSEAASLAGNLHLGKLIYLYDSNGVQQDGFTVSFSENVSLRFQAYGWNVIGPIDGLDPEAVDKAIREAQSQDNRPNLIIARTIIGYGSPHKAGTSAAHGEPLGAEEVRLTKENLHWDYPDPFMVPPEVKEHLQKAVERGKLLEGDWRKCLAGYRQIYPMEAGNLEKELQGELPTGWDNELNGLYMDSRQAVSTRDASGAVLNYLSDRVPALIGGAADVAGSLRTVLKGQGDLGPPDYSGRNIRYGLREHAMAGLSNGLALHGGLIPFAGTFLIFSDYLRPALRLGAIMKLGVIYLFSHDSIGLGEDGPTHQPIEHLMGLRALPELVMIRPADAAETVEAWKIALARRNGPTAIVLTRQRVPILDRMVVASAAGVHRGGYILWEYGDSPRIVLLGTGSEVHIALESGQILKSLGISSRVVSLPSWSIFDSQPIEYRDHVLPPQVKARVSIEAGATLGWEHYIGTAGTALGISHFGASAPGPVIYQKSGLTAENMAAAALKLL